MPTSKTIQTQRHFSFSGSYSNPLQTSNDVLITASSLCGVMSPFSLQKTGKESTYDHKAYRPMHNIFLRAHEFHDIMTSKRIHDTGNEYAQVHMICGKSPHIKTLHTLSSNSSSKFSVYVSVCTMRIFTHRIFVKHRIILADH